MTTSTLEQARMEAINRRLSSIRAKSNMPIGTTETIRPQNTGGLIGGIGYTAGQIGLGAMRGLEGVWDFLAGGIADMFGADQWAYEQMTTSPFDDAQQKLNEWYNPSKAMQFVGDVATGVGQMLPSIAVGAATGGVGSAATFMTSAAGMSTSEAAKKSGQLGGKEWLYGTASGALEGAIESVSGGIGGSKLGTVLGKKVAKSTAGKLGATFVGEGLEEVASDLIDPSLQRITGVDKEAKIDYKQLPNTFLVGGATGAVLGGAGRAIQAKRVGSFNTVNAMEDVQALREAEAKGNVLQAEGKLDSRWANALESRRKSAISNLQTRFAKMDTETKEQFIKQNELTNVFDTEGQLLSERKTITPEIQQQMEGMDETQRAEFIAKNKLVEPKTVAPYNEAAVSFSARDEANRGELRYAPTQAEVREDISKAVSDVARLSNGQTKVVVVDSLSTPQGAKVNGLYDHNTKTMYIANDGDTEGVRSFVVGHEYTHGLEGTKQYAEYADYVLKAISSDPELREKYNYDKYAEQYRPTLPENASEKTLDYVVNTEMIADFTAKEILSNEKSIDRLVAKNKNLAARVYNWVKDKISALVKSGKDNQTLSFLRTAERKLSKAMNKYTGGVSVASVDRAFRMQEEIEKKTELVQKEEFDADEQIDEFLSDAEARYSFMDGGGYMPDFSMSNRAVEAYQSGEKPLSKWTKSELLEALPEDISEYAKKLTVQELKDELLYRSSWHHTSKYYNRTDFYSIDENRIETLTKKDIDEIISMREPKAKKEEPRYITALVSYTDWEGSQKRRKPIFKKEIIRYRSDAKMVKCKESNSPNKRLSSVNVLFQIDQKTKYATDEQVVRKMEAERKRADLERKRIQDQQEKLRKKVHRLLGTNRVESSSSGNYYRYGEKPTPMDYDIGIKEGLQRVFIKDNEPILQTYKNGEWVSEGAEDIRYSISIDGEETPVKIEQVKDLVAIHNLSEEKFIKALNLGGFPAPSIAIVKSKEGHTPFGNISVIFGKETIDPVLSKQNYVYTRDAWTPVFPQPDVLLNRKQIRENMDSLEKIVDNYPVYKDEVPNLYNELERSSGDYVISDDDLFADKIGYKALVNNAIMAAYLKEESKNADIAPIYEEKLYGTYEYTVQEMLDLAKELGITKENWNKENLYEKFRYGSDEYQSAFKKVKESIYNKYLSYGKKKIAEGMSESLSFSDFTYFIDDIRSLLSKASKGGDYKTYNKYATQEKLEKQIEDKTDFGKWVYNNYYKNAIEQKGIRNKKDAFTASGKRRSFSTLYDPFTLESIVNNMRAQARVGNEGNWGATVGSIGARLAREFKSVKDIKEASKLLVVKDEEAVAQTKQQVSDMILELRDEVAGVSSDSESAVRRGDDVLGIFSECASVSPLTTDKIWAKWKAETRGYEHLNYKFGRPQAQKLKDILTILNNIPISYFEAKPLRNIGFDEIKMVELPEGISEELTDLLDKKDIPYEVYGKTDEERTKAINNLEDVRFSVSDKKYDEAVKSGNMAQAQKLVDESAKEWGAYLEKDGKPKTFYHGTSSRFTKFNESKMSKRNVWGKGYYFSSEKYIAKDYADSAKREDGEAIILPAYLKINNPYVEGKSKLGSVKSIKDKYLSDMWKDYEQLGYDYIREKLSKTPLDLLQFIAEHNGVEIRDILQEMGYDGVESGSEFVVFSPNQIKSADAVTYDDNGKIIPLSQRFGETEDIRYSVSGEKKVSRAQYSQKYADYNANKKYSKADAKEIIDSIIDTTLTLEEGEVSLKGKNREESVQRLWNQLNSLPPDKRRHGAEMIADSIIEESTFENYYAAQEQEVMQNEADYFLASTRPYMHKLNLSSMKKDIQSHFGSSYPLAIWSAGEGNGGISVEALAQELQSIGINIDADANPFDIFLELEEKHRDAVETKKQSIKEFLKEAVSESKLAEIKREMVDKILQGYETKGRESKYSALKKLYHERMAEDRQKMENLARYFWAKDKIKYTLNRWRNKSFSIEFEPLNSVKKLLMARGAKNTRIAVAELASFYTAENEALEGYYDEGIREAIDNFNQYFSNKNAKRQAEGKRAYPEDMKLDLYEMENLAFIMQAMNHLFNTYDTAFLNGERVKVTDTAQKEIDTIGKNKPYYKSTPLGRKGTFGKILRSIVDVRTLGEWVDGGEKGIMSQILEDLAHASTVESMALMELNKDFDEFSKAHKTFYKDIDKEMTFTFNGKEVSLKRSEAMSLYLTSLQEDGLYHLALGGFAVGEMDKDIKRVQGYEQTETNPDLREDADREVMEKARADFNKMYEQFTESEKEYMKLTSKMLNGRAKEMKQEVDMERLGVTNATVDNYFPLKVYETGRTQSQNQAILKEFNMIANQSIHKNRVQGSKQPLSIRGINMIVPNHIRQIATYYAYAKPLDTLRRVINKNISKTEDGKTDTANVKSIKTELRESGWYDFDEYMQKFQMDIQGANVKRSTVDRIIRWMRSNFAKFQLGLNIKTMLSQLTSLPMIMSRVGFKNMIKGMFAPVNVKEMYEYSDWAKARDYENAAYKAESLIDNVDKVGQFAMRPISKMDMFTMNRIYNSAKYFIAETKGLSIESVEVKEQAAELLEELGRRTQNNSETAEKSALMRSDNEIMKSLVMFSSDSMKQFSTLVQALNKVAFLKQKAKADPKFEKQYAEAKKEAAKAFASVGTSMVMYVLMGMLINYGLFAKDPEDDETMVGIFFRDLFGSVTGMIPIVRDIYSMMVEGFEIDSFTDDTLNNMFGSIRKISELIGKAASGAKVENNEWTLALRKFSYAIGQGTGIPVRNVYNLFYGLTKRFAPSTAYEINSFFYGSKTSDLQRAIDKGNQRLAVTVTREILSNKGIQASDELARTYTEIYKNGIQLPHNIPKSVTVDGEQVALNARQQGVIAEQYIEASEIANRIVQSRDFISLSVAEKASALALVFNTASQKGIVELGLDDGNNRSYLLGATVDLEKAAAFLGALVNIQPKKDRHGKPIPNSRKEQIQRMVRRMNVSAAEKYIIMGYLGYRNTKGESAVKSLIRRKGLTREQRTAIMQMCGYETA